MVTSDISACILISGQKPNLTQSRHGLEDFTMIHPLLIEDIISKKML